MRNSRRAPPFRDRIENAGELRSERKARRPLYAKCSYALIRRHRRVSTARTAILSLFNWDGVAAFVASLDKQVLWVYSQEGFDRLCVAVRRYRIKMERVLSYSDRSLGTLFPLWLHAHTDFYLTMTSCDVSEGD